MSELQSVARLKIHDGKLDEFKRLAMKCAEIVRTKDTGTLQYEQYLNGDNTECLVFERYRDSQALLDHLKNLGDTMAAILQTCSASGEICGTPSPELIGAAQGCARSDLQALSGKVGDSGGRIGWAGAASSWASTSPNKRFDRSAGSDFRMLSSTPR